MDQLVEGGFLEIGFVRQLRIGETSEFSLDMLSHISGK